MNKKKPIIGLTTYKFDDFCVDPCVSNGFVFWRKTTIYN